MENKPNYYAVIPANVRYDKELKDKAKLLYGEIMALSNKEGYCWATNSYFAELYGVSKMTISRLIQELAKRKYIGIEMKYKEDSKEIVNRYIKISIYPIYKNVDTPIYKKLKDNNTSINNTSINNIRYYDDDELNDLFLEFIDFRKKLKAVNSERAINNLLKALEPYPDNVKKQMINKSITSSWKGIFPLKEQKKERKSIFDL